MFVMLAIGKKRFFLLNCAPSYLVSEYFQWLPKIATVGARVFTDTHSYRRRSHGQHGHCPCEAPSFEKARLLTHFLWATGSHGQLAKRERSCRTDGERAFSTRLLRSRFTSTAQPRLKTIPPQHRPYKSSLRPCEIIQLTVAGWLRHTSPS